MKNLFPFPLCISAEHVEAYGEHLRHLMSHGRLEDLPKVVSPHAAALAGLNLASASAVKVIPIYGMIAPVSAMYEDYGYASVSRIREDVARAVAAGQDIVLHIESPGGVVTGLGELAERIEAASESVDVYAYSSTQATSGGYWLAAAAGIFCCAPSAIVGSVGAIQVQYETVLAAEAYGRKDRTVVSDGAEAKARGVTGHVWTKGDTEDSLRFVNEAAAPFVEFIRRRRGMLPPAGLVWQAESAPTGTVDLTRVMGQALDSLEEFLQSMGEL